MTSREMEEYFQEYNKYLRVNGLEIEFKKLHFLKRENAIVELEKLNNPYRAYLKPLILGDSRKNSKVDIESK